MAMNDPQTYHKFCEVPGKIVRDILPEIKDKLSLSDKEYVLDVGCGPGINTAKNLSALLPDGSTIIGSDLSEQMINFAKEHYSNSQINFKVLDITENNLRSSWDKEKFTKIFSFYTMHRIVNQRKAYENMYDLMKPGGELITITPTENCMELILPYLANMPKYSDYAEEISKMRVHLKPTQNYISVTNDKLKEAGFQVKLCKYVSKTFCAPSIDYLVEFYGIVSYLSRILPSNLFEEAMMDAKRIVIENNLLEKTTEGYLLKYVVLVVIARKPL